MFQDLLRQIGLNPNESLIYDFLLKKGTVSAGEIIKNTPLKRGVVYNTLKDLFKKELILTENRRKIAFFSPNHPQKLQEIAENRQIELQKAQKNLHANLPTLASAFSLVSNQPGVQFFEGERGLKKALENTLSAQELIYTYADVESIEKYAKKVNQKYRQKRQKLAIKKRTLVPNSPFCRQFMANYDPESIETRFLDYQKFPFSATLQIYDNKILYVSLSKESKIALLINDQSIYQMHRSLFEMHWENAHTWKNLPKIAEV